MQRWRCGAPLAVQRLGGGAGLILAGVWGAGDDEPLSAQSSLARPKAAAAQRWHLAGERRAGQRAHASLTAAANVWHRVSLFLRHAGDGAQGPANAFGDDHAAYMEGRYQ